MANIDIVDLTTGEVDGTGVFDKLMQSVQARLDDQFTKNRIKGTDYSNVYLAAMDSAMQQSIAFLLGKQQADKQAELIEAQTNSQIKQDTLIDTQIQGGYQDVLLKQQQVLSEQANVLLTRAKVETEELQPDVVANQIIKTANDAKLTEQEILVKQQQVLSEIENVELIKAKVETEQLQPTVVNSQIDKINSDKILTNAQASKLGKDELMTVAQISKLGVDEQLVQAKVTTEGLQAEVVNNDIIKTSLQADKISADIVYQGKLSEKVDSDILIQGKQLVKLDADIAIQTKQADKIDSDILVQGKQIEKITSDITVQVKQIEKIDADILHQTKQTSLIDSQITKVAVDNDLTTQRISTEIKNTELVTSQVSKLAEEILMSQAERQIKENDLIISTLTSVEYPTTLTNARNKAEAEITLLGSDNTKVGAETTLLGSKDLTEQQNTDIAKYKVYTEKANTWDKPYDTVEPTTPEGLQYRQHQKLVAEEVAVRIDANTKLYETQDTMKPIYNTTTGALYPVDVLPISEADIGIHVDSVLQAKINKLDAETALLGQKEITEFAQTGQTTATLPTSTSVLGSNIALTDIQTTGFTKDAEQKAAKIIGDIYAVAVTADAVLAGPDIITDTNLNQVLRKVAVSAGIDYV